MATVIKRTVKDDDNAFLEGIMWKGASSTTIKAWSTDEPLQLFFQNTANHTWTVAQKNFYQNVLGEWTSVSRLTFEVTNSLSQADLVEKIVPQSAWGGGGITFADHEVPGDALLYGNAIGRFWNKLVDPSDLTAGSFAYETLLHELGHSIGLAHPHDNGGGSSIYSDKTYDHVLYTIMSYNDNYSFKSDGSIKVQKGELGPHSQTYGFRIDPAAFDIEAIQAIYGVKQSNTGDNVYTLSDKNGYWTTPWDTGGKDTLSYDGDRRAFIDLRPASMKEGASDAGGGVSYISGVFGGVTMASNRTVKSAVIENAIGGDGNDTITGNSVNNRITGDDGNDTINGGGGSGDIAVYRANLDDYTITYPGAAVVLTQKAGTGSFDDGTDRVTNFEYFKFKDGLFAYERASETARSDGHAYLLDDSLTDKVASLIAGFVVGEDLLELDASVFTGLGKGVVDDGVFTLGSAAKDADDRLIYNAARDALFYDADGSGEGEKLLVARFADDVDLGARDILVV
ncbi:Ca2+-binding RTX toxin-like protein [Rhizobium sp. SG_E_25_P2]|uniref:M10 family metallopeptidase C-terminal domain-containing protein n=1 Tax=Rhizobium sp. SG_E_25_P2 TaxID=2879942 RepID=UPI002473F801|nr:M10 family metallopeptidase C-terminal domain-containing protein [Rhizobium sp. SG_E_25_P2]MDH6269174.1 Ca2+-binding RTX toxin-like protein [Rhizobium sp. SG_E_25_P2]